MRGKEGGVDSSSRYGNTLTQRYGACQAEEKCQAEENLGSGIMSGKGEVSGGGKC